jgi:hypothetical protein
MSKRKQHPSDPNSLRARAGSLLAESLALKLERVKAKLKAPIKTIKKIKKKVPIRTRVEKYYYRPGQTNWHAPKPK